MKEQIKNILKNVGIWEKIQWSNWYLSLKNPKFLANLEEDYIFYKSILGDGKKLIIDIGANQGNKTLIFERLANKVISVDPDKENYRILNSRFGQNKGIKIVNKAVGEKEGEATFFIFGDKDAYNTISEKQKEIVSNDRDAKPIGSYKVQITTLQQLVDEFGIPDYVKIDVEGYEKNVIQGLKTNLPFLSVEANLPAFTEETIWCIQYLNTLADGKAKFNYVITTKWEFPDFVDAQTMETFLRTTKLGYMEVYCKNNI
jgi:FkbM family methyltransferase